MGTAYCAYSPPEKENLRDFSSVTSKMTPTKKSQLYLPLFNGAGREKLNAAGKNHISLSTIHYVAMVF